LDCKDITFSNSCALKSLCSILQCLKYLDNERLNRHPGLESHLEKFSRKAQHIYNELGPWAADFFILESIRALETNYTSQVYMLHGGSEMNQTLIQVLKQGAILDMLENRPPQDTSTYPVSPKVEQLMSFLDDQDHSKCSGLLFVQRRITVSVLYSLLSNHPRTKGRFQCATFVGLSNYSARRYALAELLDLKAQKETLNEFRARQKNIVIATDALEEGIDVTACNLVICFDPPPNVKSFIQRRGRARQEKSKFAIMFSVNEAREKIKDWECLEARLIETYLCQEREIQSLAEIENNEEVVPGKLQVDTTGYVKVS
jgi:ERCC4-related helicase